MTVVDVPRQSAEPRRAARRNRRRDAASAWTISAITIELANVSLTGLIRTSSEATGRHNGVSPRRSRYAVRGEQALLEWSR